MKRIFVVVTLVWLAACGVETTTVTATGAAIKAREVEEGKKTQERVQQKIDQALEQAQQRAQRADDTDAK